MVKETITAGNPTLGLSTQSEERGSLVHTSRVQDDSYANIIGAFANAPMFDAMIANIYTRRREIDADDIIE